MLARTAAMDATFTMAPLRLPIMGRATARQRLNVPPRLAESTSSQFWGSDERKHFVSHDTRVVHQDRRRAEASADKVRYSAVDGPAVPDVEPEETTVAPCCAHGLRVSFAFLSWER